MLSTLNIEDLKWLENSYELFRDEGFVVVPYRYGGILEEFLIWANLEFETNHSSDHMVFKQKGSTE